MENNQVRTVIINHEVQIQQLTQTTKIYYTYRNSWNYDTKWEKWEKKKYI